MLQQSAGNGEKYSWHKGTNIMNLLARDAEQKEEGHVKGKAEVPLG